MPFELNDSGGVSASSHFYDERLVRLWKSKVVHEAQGMDGMLPMHGNKSVASSPMEDTIWVQDMKLPETYLTSDLKGTLGVGGEANNTSCTHLDWPSKSSSNLSMQPESYSLDGKRIDIRGTQYESSLFSCSLSETFSRKMRLSGNALCSAPSNNVASCYEKEHVESLKEIEMKNIGNLLPNEEDLFSGMTDDLGYRTNVNTFDDVEDFDLFSSGGGMELEGNDRLCAMQKSSGFIGGGSSGQGITNGSHVGEHPSRTLFIRNINNNVEDSELKSTFEQYGDIQTLYTACKHRGFVMVSYYDLRAAQNSMRALQNKSLGGCRELDIHYSIPKENPLEKYANQGPLVVFNVGSSVSNEELHQIFSVYGEIKEIREFPHTRHLKFIEFYDIRVAETALRALNKIGIDRKQIRLEPSQPGGAIRLVQLSLQEQDEYTLSCSPCGNLSSGCMVMVSPVVITSCGLESGPAKSLHSATRSPVSAYLNNAFPHQSSSSQNTMFSPVRTAYLNTEFNLYEPNHPLGEMKFQSQYIPSLHPHSLPEIHENLVNGNSYNSSNITDLLASVCPRHIQRVGRDGHPIELNGGVSGPSGNGNCLPHGRQYIWSHSNSYQHHPSSPVMWSNSPSSATSIRAHQFQQMPGFLRAPPPMLNTASSVHHHVGSAPAANPSIWNTGHTFPGESPEASNYHLGSLGNAGFAGGLPPHSMETASHIFSHVGSCLDMTANTGLPSPRQTRHIFPGERPMMSMQASFSSLNERTRSFSHRRNEANSNHAEKKLFELDVDRIKCGEDTRTTLMIKNIPNKYTSKMLLAAIDEHCRGSYDFIYLPIDFKNKCNVGYAFINMVDPQKIIPFYQAFNGRKWEKFNSEKVACLAYARIQGKAALIVHFQNSSLMNEDKRCRPILFHTAGPNAGDQEPFPMGTNIRPRPGKPRGSGNEDSHEGSLFAFADGEE